MQLPPDFINNIKPLLGSEWEEFELALRQDSPVSIRINPGKGPLSKQSYTPVPWSQYGYYLPQRPSFTFDPLFHAGAYYVQEASSMFIEQVFEQYTAGKDVKVLDLCAAPGGKSTHIASLITTDSLLVSNEVIRSRSKVLSENITKAGYPNVVVTNNDPSDFKRIPAFFDAILVDAPCSGEGMFRKDPQALQEWSPANVQLCAERQRRIIADVWDSLKPGGLLIYSTCTYNRCENEDNIRWIKEELGAKDLLVDVKPEWCISPSYDAGINACHFFPHKLRGEGFFVAVLRKDDDSFRGKGNNIFKNRNKQKANSLPQEFRDYIVSPGDYIFFDKGASWFAFPQKQHEDFLSIQSQLKVVSAGIYIGEAKGKDFVPQHSLAMSGKLNEKAFVCHDVDWGTAIRYLRCESLNFTDLPKGFVLLTYRKQPLGFIKNIGNRANNLYPNEWRILSSHIPENEINIF